ncbi:sugar kinase [Halarsenatibacter silvermanii]|uniref:Sugar or nucleoside kinase, ribokinase family n=1 Tax=Halarsenatibacter silvermanii TaxID=321763 RepID=A0A1G9LZ08_9FIRM|nr:sugar kinase [Halarsenatibacter silvermanii]SDL67166.1 Sugar or nucleoside kinase, ribokinase family [Halarsenatibacter silvermanii]
MPEVITAGEILVEIMATETDQTFEKPGTLMGPYPSGAPAIFLDQAARMGAETGMIAAVGDDEFGEMTKRRLAEDGADVSQVATKDDFTTGTAFVTYFSDGSRRFIYHFTHAAAGQLSPEDVDPEYVKSADFLHVMGCSLSGSESLKEAILKAIEAADQSGVKISFDPNLRIELLELERFRDLSQRVLQKADIVLSGREELDELTEGNAAEGARNLIAEGAETVILKAGEKKTEVFHGDEHWWAEPFPAEEVDPTGAGDCFDGAFIAALSRGHGAEKAVQYGMAAGALSVQARGPMEGAAFKSELDQLLK